MILLANMRRYAERGNNETFGLPLSIRQDDLLELLDIADAAIEVCQAGDKIANGQTRQERVEATQDRSRALLTLRARCEAVR